MSSISRPARTALRLAGALAVEVTSGLVMLASIRGGGPGPWHTGIEPWLRSRDPIDVAAQVAAWVAATILAYLVFVTVLHLVAVLVDAANGTTRTNRFRQLAIRMGPRWLASLAATATIAGTMGTGCSSMPSTLADAVHATAPARTPVTMVIDPAPPTTAAPPVTMVLDPAPPATAARPDSAASDVATSAETPSGPPPEPRAETTTDAPDGTAATVEVQRGDSFWSIAERATSDRLGRPALDVEIRPYWLILVEVNRARLVDPTDPGLLHPGQHLVLP